MAIIKHKDKRSGITYVYESKSYWDSEKKQSRAKRRLIGRLDEETGEIIQTDGRCKRRSPSYEGADDDGYEMPKTMKELKTEIRRLLAENRALKALIADMEKEG